MDTVRCLCPTDSLGARCGRHPACAIHGVCSVDPIMPYQLSDYDRKLLSSFRIATVTAADIAETRAADEGRFNPPRQA